MNDADAEGHAVNRLAKDGRISPLEFLKGAGWPIYHLRTQLRMAVGQFEICKETGGQCDITRPEHSIGVTFEAYITTKYPEVAPSPAGQLMPVALVIFGDINVVGTIDQVQVKANPDEKEAACPIVLSHTPEGDVRKCRLKMLRRVHVTLVAASRSAVINTKGLGGRGGDRGEG
ncbi:hypothetical protein EDB80DRAFT_868652 [Ilyonectria destructans]|nr:hypothetical protein EDB80DRAFT_868652 [Ilyonectria destructans]